MARRICIIALACLLSACASTGARLKFAHPAPLALSAPPPPPPPPRPAEGLWAILDPGCGIPDRIDTRVWPKCASPFWISHESALVIGSRPGPRGQTPSASYRADLRLTPGDPLIVQVGTPRDGYIFLALAKLDRNAEGRMVGAIGTAFACRGGAAGPISLKPNTGGCDLASLEDMRKAAQETLRDENALSRVAWVAPGAP